MEIWIPKKNVMIANNVTVCNTFTTRLKGWLGKQHIKDDEALLITPCSSIHTVGMMLKIDVLFLNANDEIVFLIKEMKPFRFSPFGMKAAKVVELKEGTIDRYNLEMFDQVSFM